MLQQGYKLNEIFIHKNQPKAETTSTDWGIIDEARLFAEAGFFGLASSSGIIQLT